MAPVRFVAIAASSNNLRNFGENNGKKDTGGSDFCVSIIAGALFERLQMGSPRCANGQVSGAPIHGKDERRRSYAIRARRPAGAHRGKRPCFPLRVLSGRPAACVPFRLRRKWAWIERTTASVPAKPRPSSGPGRQGDWPERLHSGAASAVPGAAPRYAGASMHFPALPARQVVLRDHWPLATRYARLDPGISAQAA